ncbi:MAG: flavodoxin family protein [Planctomycetota bacterium]
MPTILVLYHSQEHGNTGAMAEAIAEGARQAGAEVELLNTNDARLDVQRYRAFDAAAFGSPDYYSYLAGGLKVFLDDWYIAKQSNADGLTGKPYALFYSHGGGGRVKEPLEMLFSRMGEKVGDTVESVGRPADDCLEACRTLGQQLAEAV